MKYFNKCTAAIWVHFNEGESVVGVRKEEMYRPRTSAATAMGVPKTAALPVTSYATATVKTSAGPIVPTQLSQIPDGRLTQTIYSLLRDKKYKAVIKLILSHVADLDGTGRAAASLLGYAYFMIEDYSNASKW